MSAASSQRAVMAALVGNVAIAAAKLTAALLGSSASMVAEALHSFADSGNQVLLLIGAHLASQGLSRKHPFGRATETYFWPFLVSVMLFAVGGCFALYEGVHRLFSTQTHPPTTPTVLAWSYGILGFSLIVELVSWTIAFAEFRKELAGRSIWRTLNEGKDPTLAVVMLEDSAALLGLVLALVGMGLAHATGWTGFDALGSCLIGILLCWVGWFLGKKTHSLLLGESLHPSDETRLNNIVAAHARIKHVNQLLSMHLGPHDVLVALKVTFEEAQSLPDIEQSINEVESTIRAQMPHINHIFIEPDSHYDPHRDPARNTLA